MKKIPDWIVLDYHIQPPKMKCVRCGEIRELHIPAAIEDALNQAQAFSLSHQHCKLNAKD